MKIELLRSLALSFGLVLSGVTPSGFALPTPLDHEPIAQRLQVGSEKLCWTGSGIRKKGVFITQVSVYRLDSYWTCPTGAAAPSAAGVLAAPQRALKLTFVRDVSAEKIRSSFQKGLEANGFSSGESSPAGKVLSQMEGELKEGQVVWITASSDGAKESVTIELPNRKIESNGTLIATQFWKIWFGRSEEKEMIKLQQDLLSRTNVQD